MGDKSPILYLCDRTACKDCGPECKLTTDIAHAKNFKKQWADTYVEQTKEKTFWANLIAAAVSLTVTVGALALGFKLAIWAIS